MIRIAQTLKRKRIIVVDQLEIGEVYPRSVTTLSKAGAGINYVRGTVLGIVVNFAADAPYPDARLTNGRILHIGEGVPGSGDQKRVGGNRGMVEMMERNEPIPTFEKVMANQYRYLGEFLVSGFEFGLLDQRFPDWRGFKFTLEPSGKTAAQIPSAEELGEFVGDVDPVAPPERIAAIVSRFKRSKAIVEQVKRENNYTCQQCGLRTSWLTSAEVPYCEAHHVIALGEDGFDTDANLVLLCSNCHSEIHYSQSKDTMKSALRIKLGI